MPGTSDSKLEAIGPVRVDMAPVLMVVGVTPGEPVAAAHAALWAASGRTAAVALADGTLTTAPAATTAHAPALAARRPMTPFRLVFIASPSFQLVITLPRSGYPVLVRPQRGHCSCRPLRAWVATTPKPLVQEQPFPVEFSQ